MRAIKNGLSPHGILVVGTFSTNGPAKCSGIEIKQYSQESMATLFDGEFTKVECKIIDHTTPLGSVQNFIFCSFSKNK